jgi:hypothetical protein
MGQITISRVGGTHLLFLMELSVDPVAAALGA